MSSKATFSRRVVRTQKRTSDPVTGIDDVAEGALLAFALIDMAFAKEERAYSLPTGSAVHDLCVREMILGHKLEKARQRYIDLNWALTFEIGNLVHRMVQNDPKWLGDRRVGWWQCLACGKTLRFGKPPLKCEHCSALPTSIVYKEHGIKCPLPVTGHPDMILEVTKALFRLLEIKTITTEEFKKLSGPWGAHVYQLSLYMELIEKDKSIPIKVDGSMGYIIYFSKQHAGKVAPVKAYRVPKNKMMVEEAMSKIDLYGKAYNWKEREINFLPAPVDECMRKQWDLWRARQCEVSPECKRLAQRRAKL